MWRGCLCLVAACGGPTRECAGVYEACHVGREATRERDVQLLRSGADGAERAFDWTRCWGGWDGHCWSEAWSEDYGRVSITESQAVEQEACCSSSDSAWEITAAPWQLPFPTPYVGVAASRGGSAYSTPAPQPPSA